MIIPSGKEIEMGATNLEMAMTIWATSDQAQKRNMMRKFLETRVALTSENDFIGFIVTEFNLDTAGQNSVEISSGD